MAITAKTVVTGALSKSELKGKARKAFLEKLSTSEGLKLFSDSISKDCAPEVAEEVAARLANIAAGAFGVKGGLYEVTEDESEE